MRIQNIVGLEDAVLSSDEFIFTKVFNIGNKSIIGQGNVQNAYIVLWCLCECWSIFLY